MLLMRIGHVHDIIEVTGCSSRRLLTKPWQPRIASNTVLVFRDPMSQCRMIGFLLGRLLARARDTGALVRTTAAVTLLSGGTAQNVLPQTGNFTLNFRHLPGTQALQH